MACSNGIDAACWLGESYGFWIQTGAIVLSAIAAVAVIWISSRSAKKRATIDLILDQHANDELNAALAMVYTIHDDQKKFTDLPAGSDERKALVKVLNYFEFVSLGIRRKAFDETIYKNLKFSDLMRLWKASEVFVADIRNTKNSKTIYQEFEWLSTRWQSKPLKRHCKT